MFNKILKKLSVLVAFFMAFSITPAHAYVSPKEMQTTLNGPLLENGNSEDALKKFREIVSNIGSIEGEGNLENPFAEDDRFDVIDKSLKKLMSYFKNSTLEPTKKQEYAQMIGDLFTKNTFLARLANSPEAAQDLWRKMQTVVGFNEQQTAKQADELERWLKKRQQPTWEKNWPELKARIEVAKIYSTKNLPDIVKTLTMVESLVGKNAVTAGEELWKDATYNASSKVEALLESAERKDFLGTNDRNLLKGIGKLIDSLAQSLEKFDLTFNTPIDIQQEKIQYLQDLIDKVNKTIPQEKTNEASKVVKRMQAQIEKAAMPATAPEKKSGFLSSLKETIKGWFGSGQASAPEEQPRVKADTFGEQAGNRLEEQEAARTNAMVEQAPQEENQAETTAEQNDSPFTGKKPEVKSLSRHNAFKISPSEKARIEEAQRKSQAEEQQQRQQQDEETQKKKQAEQERTRQQGQEEARSGISERRGTGRFYKPLGSGEPVVRVSH